MSKLKYGMATVSAMAAFVGVAGLLLPQALADDVMGIQVSDFGTQGAKIEFEIQKQECDTLKNSQPQAYEPCMQKAQSTRDSLLSQIRDSDQGSQGSPSSQSQQLSGQEKGPIDKMTSAVKEKLADWGIGSSDKGREAQQPQGQSTGQGRVTQGQHPLQQGFDPGRIQGQGLAPQSVGAGSEQGGQNFGQQGLTQGQGQSGQGSFQGGNYAQQSQSQPCKQDTGGANQQFQTGGTQGQQQGSNDQVGSTSGSAGAETEHMGSVEYYKVLAHQQYATLKQDCNTLKQDANVYEQCLAHAKSVRDKIAGMAEQGDQRGG